MIGGGLMGFWRGERKNSGLKEEEEEDGCLSVIKTPLFIPQNYQITQVPLQSPTCTHISPPILFQHTFTTYNIFSGNSSILNKIFGSLHPTLLKNNFVLEI